MNKHLISFERFIIEDGSPIYIQIIEFLKKNIVSGLIANGDELPSRRVLSSLLGVNPNTVQKAYRILEEEGLIESHSGAKSYVVLENETVDKLKNQMLESDATSVINSLKQMGISKKEALSLIEKYW